MDGPIQNQTDIYRCRLEYTQSTLRVFMNFTPTLVLQPDVFLVKWHFFLAYVIGKYIHLFNHKFMNIVKKSTFKIFLSAWTFKRQKYQFSILIFVLDIYTYFKYEIKFVLITFVWNKRVIVTILKWMISQFGHKIAENHFCSHHILRKPYLKARKMSYKRHFIQLRKN